jgi:thioredoxin-related protein
LYNKFKTFAQQIFQLEPEFSIPIVLKVLNDSKKNSNMFYALFDYLEHEFGTHKSPYRDESLYIAMLKEILNTPDVEETRTLRYEYELKLITKNLAGEKANNFNIVFANGDSTTMYDIEAELLMLYFQNPDCPTCGDIREKMKNMEIVNQAIAAGKLKIVTIYFEQKEDLWRNYLNTRALKNWQHGWNYDLEISEKHLYDIRSIPMIMFLDKNKKVIKKDILWNDIEEWLKRFL